MQSLSANQTYQHHRLANTIHLTLKMTSVQVIETSVTKNNSLQNYTHPDDRAIRTTDKLLLERNFRRKTEELKSVKSMIRSRVKQVGKKNEFSIFVSKGAEPIRQKRFN